MGSPFSIGSKYWWDKCKDYDRKLFLKWNGEINRWELWREGQPRLSKIMMNIDGCFQDTNLVSMERKPVKILTMELDEKTPVPVDRRLYEVLMATDSNNWKNAHQWAKEISDKEDEKRNKGMKNLGEQLDWVAKDTRRYVAKDVW